MVLPALATSPPSQSSLHSSLVDFTWPTTPLLFACMLWKSVCPLEMTHKGSPAYLWDFPKHLCLLKQVPKRAGQYHSMQSLPLSRAVWVRLGT